MTARSYLTAGVAALGVGAIMLTPVQPIPSQAALAPQRVVSDLAVSLAAAVDPIQAWVGTFEDSAANLGILGEFYMQKPFPLLQTLGANIGTYFEELGDGNAGLIPGQIWNNIQTFFNAPWDPGAQITIPPAGGCSGSPCPLSIGSPFEQNGKLPTASDTEPIPAPGAPAALSPQGFELAALQLLIGVGEGGIPAFAGLTGLPLDEAEQLWVTLSDNQMLLDQLWTPAGGQLVALLGPVIAPLVQLTRSFTAIGEAFQAGEALDAVYELINIPANMTNAFLNGLELDEPLDLTGVINSFFSLPEGFQIGLQLGGLLNTMPYNGSLVDPDNPPTEYSGGVLFDNLSVVGEAFPLDTPPTGLKNGWAGSVVGLGQYLADQLLVTPPEPPTAAAAAEPSATKQAAALDIPAPALTEAPADEEVPAVVDVPAPAEESAPAIVAELEESAPADLAEVEAAVAATETAVSEPVEADAPSAPEAAATGNQSADDDTDRAGGNNRRGAR